MTTTAAKTWHGAQSQIDNDMANDIVVMIVLFATYTFD